MAFPRLDIVDTDETTVLWSFNDQLGAVNPNSVKAKLGPIDFGVRSEITTAEYLANGGQVSGYRDPIATATLTFYPAAATADARTTGLGVLNKLLERGGVMIWQPTPGSPLRYIDFVASPHFSVYQGQHVANLASVDEGVALQFLMQPYLRAAEVSVTGVTVPNDPATSTKVRVFPLTVSGDLPTPGRVRVQMDSGATVERTLIAHRAQGNKASSVMADYLSETGFAQVEASGRGWTRTLGTDTTATTDANASPGSGTSKAVTTFATNDDLVERVKLTRSTLMDSLRGSWDVHVRVKAETNGVFDLQLKWLPAAAGEAIFVEPAITHDTSLVAVVGWVELKLGTIHIPEGTGALGGLQLRLFAGAASAASDLEWDFVWFAPHDRQGTVVVPSGGVSSWTGRQLKTPPTSPGGLGTGTVVGSEMKLDANGDAAGTPPNAGIAMPVGRHIVTFVVRNALSSTCDVEVRLRNVTDSASVPAQSFMLGSHETRTEVLTFDTIAAKFYQLQVVNTQASASDLRVVSITEEYLPTLGTNESFRTEPGDRYGIDRLDSSGNLAGYLTVEGEIPAWLEPGLNHLMVRCDDVNRAGYDEGENLLPRTPTVSVLCSPRYAL